MRKALTKQEMQSVGMGMRGGRSSGGRPYDYDRGFNQGKALLFTLLAFLLICCGLIFFFYLFFNQVEEGGGMEMVPIIVMAVMVVS